MKGYALLFIGEDGEGYESEFFEGTFKTLEEAMQQHRSVTWEVTEPGIWTGKEQGWGGKWYTVYEIKEVTL